MQKYRSLFTQCHALYRQWLVAGGFSAKGMFMEGHYCLREPAILTEVNKSTQTRD